MNTWKHLAAAVAAALALVTGAAHGTTYYVRMNGNDANSGLSWAAPKQSIQAAVNAAAANDTVVVTNGTYWSFSTTNKAVRIQSVNGAEVTIIESSGMSNCASLGSLISHTNSVLVGFTLRGSRAKGSVCGTLYNCALRRNAEGGARYGVLHNCVVSGNGGTAMSDNGGGTYFSTLNNCLLFGNETSGLGGGAYGGRLSNCTVTGNRAASDGGGVWLDGYSSLTNCVVWGNTRGDGTVNNYVGTWTNISYSCTAPAPSSGMGNTGNISADPMFVSTILDNYRLKAGSPCVNTGSTASAPGATDLDGSARVYGGAVDMGAYELEYEVAVQYVRPDGNDAADGATWATAKRTLQRAVSLTAQNGTVTVTNGTYAPFVSSNKTIRIQSVNGAAATLIDGGGTNRCATLGTAIAHTNTVLTGFTLRNGNAAHANVRIQKDAGGGSYGGTLNTCVLTNNAAGYGGGACYGTLNACALTGNTADRGGGAYGGTLNNCTLSGNGNTGGLGGGSHGGTLNMCALTGNTAGVGGGAYAGTLNTCTLTGNVAVNGGGSFNGTLNTCTLTGNTAGTGGGAYAGKLNTCVLAGNTADTGGGVFSGELNNCTLSRNQAGAGGGASGTSLLVCWLNNCILWGNTRSVGGAADNYSGEVSFRYSCTSPSPGGPDNIAADPQFVDAAGGNFHLVGGSPCINAGSNTYAPGTKDMDGNPRILEGTADMGAYEHTTCYYVRTDGNDAANGMSWGTAKRTIQAAVVIAVAGREIFVTNGVYEPFATANKAITIRSVNGAEATAIDGGGTNRCATLKASGGSGMFTNTVLTGFTLRNGLGVDGWGGGALGGTLNDCVLTGNQATMGGGLAESCASNCILTNNTAASGGGAYHGWQMSNCVLAGNRAQDNGGAYGGTLYNCTVVGNTGESAQYGCGVENSTLYNCIVWGNFRGDGSVSNFSANCTFRYSCTTPLPSGTGNIAQAPLFADAAASDYRLAVASPCINAGLNAYVKGAADAGGNVRIWGDTVDMGAYEYCAYFVSTGGDDAAEGTSWATAKRTIQAAVAAAPTGGDIVVTNGTYAPFASGNKAVRIQSVNGPGVTIINGGNTNRCATLGTAPTHTDTRLTGFTLRNGGAVSNGGGVYGGTLTNCTLTNNTATAIGGGACYSTLNNCTVAGNKVTSASGDGGGAYDSTLNNCAVSGNTAGRDGGGGWFSLMNNCTVAGNTAGRDGGGAWAGALDNCVVSGNTAGRYGGGAFGDAGGAEDCLLSNCTVSGNRANGSGGGGVEGGTLGNCIVWGNTAATAAYSNYNANVFFSYSCTAPWPGGADNIAANPMFVNAPGGNYRLAAASPCINTGGNAYVMGAADLDGNPRIAGGTVDMGAYETVMTYYVRTGGNDAADGASWATAKRTIQGAVDAAAIAGCEVIVTNGVYAPFATANKDITLRSVNGAAATIVDGGGASRCATLGNGLNHTNTVVIGFTLRNGRDDGSGGGGAIYGTLNDCTLTGNAADYNGGGAYNSTLNRCTVTGNRVLDGGGDGGGGANSCTLNHCVVTGNDSAGYGGGAMYGTLNNCVVAGNHALNAGGVCEAALNNCTVAGNTADASGGTSDCVIRNSIVWGNTGGASSNDTYSTFAYSCTAPLPGGVGNTNASPVFVDAASGNYRLAAGSPCINKGNNAYATGTADLDGNPRIVGGTVDMGAFEYTVYYVRTDGNDAAAGTSWATAKQTIQGAVNAAAAAGNEIIVTNGVYAPFATPGKAVTIRSVNGAAETVIDGGGTNRCATLGSASGHTNTVLSGFTLRNGNASHGNVTVVRSNGGGACFGTLNACTLTNNTAVQGGGAFGGVLNACTLSGNTGSLGGGARDSTLNACALTGNTAAECGGGASRGLLNNCTLSRNSAAKGGGVFYGTLNNCILVNNTATQNGGGMYYGTLNNCTVAGNAAANGGGASEGALYNCVVWGNVLTGGGATTNYSSGTFAYSCTAPLPGGTGNTGADPMFVNAAGGNYRLAAGSPCINKGNNAYATGTADLDGNPRISGDTVDMGAYETVTTYYVRTGGDDAADGASWATAKRTIQGAVDAAAIAGCEVIVTNGVYAPFATANKAIVIRSVNGAAATIVDGGGASRCATLGNGLNHTNTVVIGFTLRNGRDDGSGGGGACFGTLSDCTLTGNAADYNGGGAYNSTLNRCTVTGNRVLDGGGDGGGGANGCTLNHCVVTGNDSAGHGGGAMYGTLNNCVVAGNHALNAGGVCEAALNNCTVAGNTADASGGTSDCVIRNSIVWGNTGGASSNDTYSTFAYSCTAPLPGGEGNTDEDPMFADAATGDFRLRPGSPCVNTGDSELVTWALDLGGNPRILGGAVDMGAFECVTTLYVRTDGDDANDGLSWATAKQTIQGAVNAAPAGNEIIVTNGIYAPFATANKAVVIRSVNGAAATLIDGGRASRCATLGSGAAHTNTALLGFTLQDGVADVGGGAYGGTLSDCVLTGNTAGYGGGAGYSVMLNCTLTGNSATIQGGGAVSCTLAHCTLTGNTAGSQGGGAYNSTLVNCLLTGNTSTGQGGGARNGTLINCTVTGNTAGSGGGTAGGTLTNCVVWGNFLTGGATNNYSGGTFAYSCTAPLPGGEGNTEDDPVFADAAAGDFRLAKASPCINTGITAPVVWARDLGGGARLVGDAVDMGAYEFPLVVHPIAYADTHGAANPNPKGYVTGDAFAFAALPDVTGRVFTGWDIPGITPDSAGPMTVTAQWAALGYPITYADVKSGANPNPATYTIEDEITFAPLPDEVGYTFAAWDIPGIARGSTGATNVTAQWTAVRYPITYADTKGAPNPNPASYTIEDAFTFAALPNVEGLTFMGWDIAGITPGSAGPIEVTAQWLSLGEALGAADWVWTTGGDAPWFVQSEVTHEAPYAAQSGRIGDGRSSWIETTVTGPGTLTFWWKASSEPGLDLLTCATGGVVVAQVSGEADWVRVTLPIFADGETAVRWTYIKDGAGAEGLDCGWLAEVAWDPTPPRTHTQYSPVPVPYVWLDPYLGWRGVFDYEDLAMEQGANDCYFWESYVANLIPTDPTSKLLITNFTVNAVGEVTALQWAPDHRLSPDPDRREYDILGKTNLTDLTDWHTPTNSATRFFRVRAKLPAP